MKCTEAAGRVKFTKHITTGGCGDFERSLRKDTMPKYRKEPYSTKAAQAAGIHCYGDVAVLLPRVGKTTTANPSWIYYVDVCKFTFVFFSIAMIREYLAYYSMKILPSSRFNNQPWSGGAPPGINENGQTRFERLPLRLRREPNRQRVIKALERAIAMFENDETVGQQ